MRQRQSHHHVGAERCGLLHCVPTREFAEGGISFAGEARQEEIEYGKGRVQDSSRRLRAAAEAAQEKEDATTQAEGLEGKVKSWFLKLGAAAHQTLVQRLFDARLVAEAGKEIKFSL